MTIMVSSCTKKDDLHTQEAELTTKDLIDVVQDAIDHLSTLRSAARDLFDRLAVHTAALATIGDTVVNHLEPERSETMASDVVAVGATPEPILVKAQAEAANLDRYQRR